MKIFTPFRLFARGVAVSCAFLLILFATGCGSGEIQSNTDTTNSMPQNNTNTVPATPENLQVSAGYKSLQVSWDAVSGATLYKLYYGTTNPPTNELTSTPPTLNKALENLNAGSTYYVRVSAMVNNRESALSTVSSAVTSHDIALNDTGIAWGGDYEMGNRTDCGGIDTSDNSQLAEQDCHQGRDAQTSLSKIGGGHGGFDFTKLGAEGSILDIQDGTWSDAGSESTGTKWSCVKDNHTGLIWEVKLNNSNSIHDKDKKYRWGGVTALGRDHSSAEKGLYYDDWNTLVNGTNMERLCGANDWRVPTLKELVSIVNYSLYGPSIDRDYFPNIFNESSFFNNGYWSSSPYANNSNNAWLVYFNSGDDSNDNRDDAYRVRLVRGRQ